MNQKLQFALVACALFVASNLLTQCNDPKDCAVPFGITSIKPTSASSQTVSVSWNADAPEAEVELFDKTTNTVVKKTTGASPITFNADPTHDFEARVKALCDDGGESEVVTTNIRPKYAININAIPKTIADSSLFCPLIINQDSFTFVQNINSNFYDWRDQDELLIVSAGTNATFSTFFIMKRSGSAANGTTTASEIIFMDGDQSGTIFCDNTPSTFPLSFGTEGKAMVSQNTITITNPITNVNLKLEIHPRGFSVIGVGQTQRINMARRI